MIDAFVTFLALKSSCVGYCHHMPSTRSGTFYIHNHGFFAKVCTDHVPFRFIYRSPLCRVHCSLLLFFLSLFSLRIIRADAIRSFVRPSTTNAACSFAGSITIVIAFVFPAYVNLLSKVRTYVGTYTHAYRTYRSGVCRMYHAENAIVTGSSHTLCNIQHNTYLQPDCCRFVRVSTAITKRRYKTDH